MASSMVLVLKEIPIDVAIFLARGDFPEDTSELVNMSGGSDIDPCCRFDNLDSGICGVGPGP
jgi:hypothetical protein